MGNTHTILIVDDEPNITTALTRVLHEMPLRIITAANGADALNVLRSETAHIIISDERMPHMAGSEFLAAAKELYPFTIRMMLTGHASIEAAVRAVNEGAIYRFFLKPWNDLDIQLAVKGACDLYDIEEENRRLLRMVRIHEYYLKKLEETHPGLPRHEKDSNGNIILSDLSDEEVDRMLNDIKHV